MIFNQASKESDIKARQSAFFMYKEEGIEIVQKYFPDQLEYIEANKEKTLLEILDDLQQELKDISKN